MRSLLLVCGVNDLQELVGLQGGPADQSAVDIRLSQQFCRVLGVHGTAVLDRHAALRRLIFKPLRMTDSHYDAWKLPKDVIERMASGYFLNPACSEYRPNCAVGKKCHIGAFVQLKNCVLGEGTKMAHLTYVGDADVGKGVNFGCGTITTNYDGFKKHRCKIGDKAFIGCNTNLVSPVEVGDGAYIAAGTTVTKDVPADALAVGRAKQENKDGWAQRRRQMNGQES